MCQIEWFTAAIYFKQLNHYWYPYPPDTIYAGHKDSVSSLAFSNDGQLLASGSFDGLIQIWDAASGNLKGTLEGPSSGIEVIFFWSSCSGLLHLFGYVVLRFQIMVSIVHYSVGQVASKGTYNPSWLRRFQCLDVECGQKCVSKYVFRSW